MILHCPNCKPHEQDKIHGKGLRVHNPTKKPAWRCTVCGNEKPRQIEKGEVKK